MAVTEEEKGPNPTSPSPSPSPSTEALIRKLHEILNDNNDVGQFSFKEETIQKLMQELYKEIIAPPSHSQDHDNKDQGPDFDDDCPPRVLTCHCF
ncbi:hypothetical protein Fmac_000550 [Flemingia macrophylla]|uniref:Uncharacterized protein n=1 Tax=Flemingia macrophylla TaxID=520843 RepID=A0ABD1NHD4_9FABA